jgi:hypothetical protein
MRRLARACKPLLPKCALDAYIRLRRASLRKQFAGKTPTEAFSAIYARRIWGTSGDPLHAFSSGSGSSDPAIVSAYVVAVRNWMVALGSPPSVCDLGCGDFRVGSQLVPFASRWTACDCVPQLIESNRRRWVHLPVQFEQIDLCAARPREADVFFIRQVLQHLSNAQISQVLANVVGRCTWLVVTEHVPNTAFAPNADKPIGSDVRVLEGSGVVLTEPPFTLMPLEARRLCRVTVDDGAIETLAYKLR